MLLSQLDENYISSGILLGTIARFTEISSDLPWFNSEKMDVADEDDVKTINIPEGLKPNYVAFYFYFDLASHTLVFEQKLGSLTVSPHIMSRYIGKLMADSRLTQKYGPIETTLISDVKALRDIINIPKLRELRILIQRPNPDDWDDFDADIEKRLKEMNATSVELTYKTDRNESLKPDRSTLQLAESATRNGKVESKGFNDNNVPISQSSDEHPLLVSHTFEGDGDAGYAAFMKAAQILLEQTNRARRGQR